MSLQFMADASSVVLFGKGHRRGPFVALGVGKTMVALNIVHQAVLQGHTALCTSAGQMLSELAALDSDSALRRRLQHYAAPDLLLIDEVGYLSYSNRHADMLFELISRRYLHKSTIVTTNRRFADWGEVFPNAACEELPSRSVHTHSGGPKVPVMRLICRNVGLDPGTAHRLFSSCRSLWRIAGLPDPGEEAKAYMN